MIKEAERKHENIDFKFLDAENMSCFHDNQFDIVTASYVLHGVKINEREKIILEMKRIASEAVVIHDFYGDTEYFIRFLEFFERSDYKFFKKNFTEEMSNHFPDSKVIITGYSTAFYIGYIS
jgi:ubiquinone/menaquinone biosynthesis C-methylase UbiE